MTANGITYNPETGRFETSWGWMKFNFSIGAVEVKGPGVNEWFDADKAVETAGMFADFCHGHLGMALALAIHGQYAAWQGLRTLEVA